MQYSVNILIGFCQRQINHLKLLLIKLQQTALKFDILFDVLQSLIESVTIWWRTFSRGGPGPIGSLYQSRFNPDGRLIHFFIKLLPDLYVSFGVFCLNLNDFITLLGWCSRC